MQRILTCFLICSSGRSQWSRQVFYRNYKQSMDIVKDIDVDDAPFVACALAYLGNTIWSEDKKLKTQSAVKVLITKEISEVI